MSVKNTHAKPLSASKLAQTRKGLTSLAALTDYNPQRPEFGPEKLAVVNKSLDNTYIKFNAAKDALDKAHDEHVASQWAAWEFYQGAGESVIGQYGANSDAYASLGYKKKSEYKKTLPGKKAPKKGSDGAA